MKSLDEWRQSAVDDALTKLNVIDIEGIQPYEYLLYSDALPRRNDGRLRDHILRRYVHIEHGGWWCSGINVLIGQHDLWGCFKPIKPQRSRDDRKLIKYEHPPKIETGIFALRVPRHIWQRIAERYEVPVLSTEIIQELPDFGFWAWVLAHPEIPVVVCEGAKKAGALLSAGYCAIALPGIFNGYHIGKDELGNQVSKPRLIPHLEKFAVPNREIYLAFDQDTKQRTVKNVHTAVKQIGKLFTKAGCVVKVIQWNSEGGLCKGCDDLIANRGSEAWDTAYNTALDLDYWNAKSYTKLTFPAKVRLNQRFLGSVEIPDSAKLVALKSAKYTGKTQLLESIASTASAQGKWVLVVGHRVQLVEALCKRFGLNYVTEVRNSETGAIFGYGLCVDSLHPESQARFIAENWEDGIVIIDEVEQVLWHTLNSSTCQVDRVPILKSLKTLIQNVLAGEGRLFIADADLSDTSLQYLMDLAGIDLDPFIIINDWKPGQNERWVVTNFDGSNPAALLKNLESHIASGGRPFVCVSAQKTKSKWSTRNLERYLGTQFPKLRILVIDSESVSDPDHPAYGCIVDLDSVLPSYDIVLASPSIETGVSIDLKGHFTSVWGIAQGVQSENSVRQSLARVRENVPRFIWAAQYGFGKVSNGETSLKALLAAQHKLTKANIQQLRAADLEGLNEDENFQSESLSCWAKLTVRHNAGMLRYRETILGGLREEGHLIKDAADLDKDELDVLITSITECRDEGYAAECDAVAAAADIVEEREYQELMEKRAKTPQERCRERKHSLNLRYGVAVTAALVAKDDENWYPQLRLHYFLSLGREYLGARDRRVAAAQVERGHGDLFKPDFNRSQLGLVIGTLELLGIPKLLNEEGRELRNSDEDLVAIAQMVKAHRSDIKAILGVGFSDKATPIIVLKRLLDKLGIPLQYLRREGTGNNRVRVYQVGVPSDGRDEIFQRWLERDRVRTEEATTSTISNKDIITIANLDSYREKSADVPPITKETLEDAWLWIEEGIAGGAEVLRVIVVEAWAASTNWELLRESIWEHLSDSLKDAVAKTCRESYCTLAGW